MKHRCGGDLQPAKLKIRKKIGYYFQTFTVDGHKCDYCGDEVISRDTAFEIDQAIEQLRLVWRHWRVPGTTASTKVVANESLFEDSNNVQAVHS